MSINTEPFQRTDISTQSLGPAFQLHRVYFLKVCLPDSPGPANYRVLMSHTIKRNNRQMRIAMLPPGFLALLWPCLCGGLLCFGFSASASYLEHLGTADRACSWYSIASILHGYLFFSLHLPLFLALYTVCLRYQSRPSETETKNQINFGVIIVD